jgi:peptide subunit release factor RF-3
MAYVLATYYIGLGNSYDGTYDTDTATIRLFISKKTAIEEALNFIRDIIREQIVGGARDSTDFTFEEEVMKRTLKNGDAYNFEDTYMVTLERCKIE